jgi:hypothetical protein
MGWMLVTATKWRTDESADQDTAQFAWKMVLKIGWDWRLSTYKNIPLKRFKRQGKRGPSKRWCEPKKPWFFSEPG